MSHGTLGMQSRNDANALLIDCVRRRSFLLLPPTRVGPDNEGALRFSADREDTLDPVKEGENPDDDGDGTKVNPLAADGESLPPR